MPFDEARQTLERLTPIKLGKRTVETITHTVAGQLKAVQEEERRAAFHGPFKLPDGAAPPPVHIGVIAADGGYCRVHDHTEPTREFKIGAMGHYAPLPEGMRDFILRDGKRTRSAPLVVDKSYCGDLRPVDDFFERFTIEFYRAGLHHVSTLQILGDGADWIWKRLPQLASPTQKLMLCLDYYHADERLNDTAKALFPNDDERRQKWCEKKSEQLIQGHLASFFRDFRVVVRNAQNSGNTALATLLEAQMNYFKVRRNYLCYRKCLDEGLLIGSGMIEGGVRFVAKDRLYRTGMIWNTAGADDILNLRCLSNSGNRWESYFTAQAKSRRSRFDSRKQAWAAGAQERRAASK
jgi:hypothetical protein